jgi:ubiquinol-cytochrome c reductase cytochrome c1 subunit
MLRKALALAALGMALVGGPALAAEHAPEPPKLAWSFEGPFGKYDTAQLQRGYKVYREVCSACHSMNLMAFRNLGQKGGPFYDAKYPNPNDNPYVKSLAKDIQVKDIDADTGDAITRPAGTADKFPAPFANEIAARASNGGALPPDFSVLAKAREGGPNYIHGILTGYAEAPAGFALPPGKMYNRYFPGHAIGMPPPLADGRVTFDDGTKPTLDQEAKDVSAFLAWAAEPKMEERKQFGLGAMIYLLIFSVLLWFSYKKIWKHVAH